MVGLTISNGLGPGLLFALLVLRPLATALCLRSGAPGGLFTPTMTFGALLGALLGRAWAAFWPGTPLGAYAILASGAVLAATTQGPVSSIVFILELTHDSDALMVPLLVAIVGASISARALEKESIYSVKVK